MVLTSTVFGLQTSCEKIQAFGSFRVMKKKKNRRHTPRVYSFAVVKHLREEDVHYLHSICADQTQQGAGKILMDYVIKDAYESQVSAVKLSSLEHVILYYKKYGFDLKNSCSVPEDTDISRSLKKLNYVVKRIKRKNGGVINTRELMETKEIQQFLEKLIQHKEILVDKNCATRQECNVSGYTMLKCFERVSENPGSGGQGTNINIGNLQTSSTTNINIVTSCFEFDIKDVVLTSDPTYFRNRVTNEMFHKAPPLKKIGGGNYGIMFLLRGNKGNNIVAKVAKYNNSLRQDIRALEMLEEKQVSSSCYFPAKNIGNRVIIMPQAKGGDLLQFLKKRKRMGKSFKMTIALNCILRMVENVQCLLQKELYYTDLKLQNILVPNAGSTQTQLRKNGLRCLLFVGDHGSLSWFGIRNPDELSAIATICPPPNEAYIVTPGIIAIRKENAYVAQELLFKIMCANILLIFAAIQNETLYKEFFSSVHFQGSAQVDPIHHFKKIVSPDLHLPKPIVDTLKREMSTWRTTIRYTSRQQKKKTTHPNAFGVLKSQLTEYMQDKNLFF